MWFNPAKKTANEAGSFVTEYLRPLRQKFADVPSRIRREKAMLGFIYGFGLGYILVHHGSRLSRGQTIDAISRFYKDVFPSDWQEILGSSSELMSGKDDEFLRGYKRAEDTILLLMGQHVEGSEVQQARRFAEAALTGLPVSAERMRRSVADMFASSFLADFTLKWAD